ncbi:MAG: ArsR/SmtB family transcription factor [Bdellovibrionota bacterium]
MSVQKNISEFSQCIHSASQYLKCLGNQHRLFILCCLSEKPMCVSELLEEIQISQPLLSQHLKALRDEGILSHRRIGQKIYYEICDRTSKTIMKTLSEKFQSPLKSR